MSGESVLIVDDDASMCQMLELGLRGSGYESVSCQSAQAALEELAQRDFDTVITDVRMRGGNGMELCSHIVQSRPDVPVIVITAFGSMETAIEAIRAGAFDFLTKPFELDTLRLTVQRALRQRSLAKQVVRLQRALRGTRDFGQLIGGSGGMRRVFELLERVAPSEAAVLLTGESGTGKELAARALHEHSQRRAGPFVAINCAAMPEALLESELFGHARGAFTDARTERRGLFLQAQAGTLFLDEIGELPLALQPKLLRALEERCVRPLGANEEVAFDARLVAATNRDLESRVEEGAFREDLYYRIQVIQIELPPLRARGNDILLLAQHFIEHFAALADKPASHRTTSIDGLTPAAAEKLLGYSWPGNVRELKNCIERAVTLARYNEIGVDDLPPKVRAHQPSQLLLAGDDPSELSTMDEIERRYVLRVFETTSGNKSLAAKILGFNRKTLYRKLRRYGVLAASEGDES